MDLSAQTVAAIALGSALDTGQGPRPMGPHSDPRPDEELFRLVNASHFPVARGVCGSWVSDYMAMQAAAVTERANPGALQQQRIAVAVTDDDGLSDRLFTITTVFLTALLSNRAFLNHFQAGYVLSEAMTSSYIDWSFTSPATPNVTFDYYEPLMSGRKKKLLREMLWLRDFTAMGARADNVVWRINSGAVMLAFDNPAVHCKLVQMGLNRENLFPCLFDFLFRPTPSTLNLYPTELQVLQDPDIVKIGIQIREGDSVFQRAVSAPVFSPHSKSLSYFEMYFECAMQLEQQYYARGAKKVVWYLVSDSVDIRRLAVEQYGADRVLTNLGHALDHTLLPYSTAPATKAHFQKTAAIAAGEMWLFSLADAHIVTEKSSGSGGVSVNNSSSSSGSNGSNNSLSQALSRFGFSRSMWLPLGMGVILTLGLLCWPYLQCLSHIGYNYIYWVVASGSIKYAAENGSLPLPLSHSVMLNGSAIGPPPLLVPRLLHQTWRTALLPEKWLEAQRSCLKQHPSWTYKLWTDDDALRLIQSKYPWFLNTYLSYPFDIQRADALRYFVLYTYGGVYLDLDIVCLKPLDGLRHYSFIAPKTYPTGISNDVLISAPGDRFAHALITGLPTWSHWFAIKYLTVMFSTGPMYVSIQYSLFSKYASVALLPPALYGKYKAGGRRSGVLSSSEAEANPSYFGHLHGSSWHEKDAGLIFWLDKHGLSLLAVVVSGVAVAGLYLAYKRCSRSAGSNGPLLSPRQGIKRDERSSA
ncbi:MAG: hypothetical protein WDW36_003161 [Sanguina aurantia]